MTNIAMENQRKSPFFIGKPSINWPFSMAMLNNQRVYNVIRMLDWDTRTPVTESPVSLLTGGFVAA